MPQTMLFRVRGCVPSYKPSAGADAPGRKGPQGYNNPLGQGNRPTVPISKASMESINGTSKKKRLDANWFSIMGTHTKRAKLAGRNTIRVSFPQGSVRVDAPRHPHALSVLTAKEKRR